MTRAEQASPRLRVRRSAGAEQAVLHASQSLMVNRTTRLATDRSQALRYVDRVAVAGHASPGDRTELTRRR